VIDVIINLYLICHFFYLRDLNSCGQWQYNIYLMIIAFTDKARIPEMALGASLSLAHF
jgi:hypothetical protein